jgi:protein gp37
MSNIEWTDVTWNPVVGCSKVSAGCTHCYAETMDRRLRAIAGEEFRPWGPQNAAYNVRLHPERLEAPLRWRKPRRVFVLSMSDLFHEAVPFEFIDQVFAVMALSPQHTFQCLSKRPERMRAYMTEDGIGRIGYIEGIAKRMERERGNNVDGLTLLGSWPLPNVWLGTSVEDQASADVRIPELLATPAAVRFLSVEPLLGPVDLTPWLWRPGGLGESIRVADNLLGWVIVGGESGPGARPCDLGWIRSIVAQCRPAGVAVFVKQLGARPVTVGELRKFDWPNGTVHGGDEARLKSSKGGAMEEWPEDLRVREWPR